LLDEYTSRKNWAECKGVMLLLQEWCQKSHKDVFSHNWVLIMHIWDMFGSQQRAVETTRAYHMIVERLESLPKAMDIQLLGATRAFPVLEWLKHLAQQGSVDAWLALLRAHFLTLEEKDRDWTGYISAFPVRGCRIDVLQFFDCLMGRVDDFMSVPMNAHGVCMALDRFAQPRDFNFANVIDLVDRLPLIGITSFLESYLPRFERVVCPKSNEQDFGVFFARMLGCRIPPMLFIRYFGSPARIPLWNYEKFGKILGVYRKTAELVGWELSLMATLNTALVDTLVRSSVAVKISALIELPLHGNGEATSQLHCALVGAFLRGRLLLDIDSLAKETNALKFWMQLEEIQRTLSVEHPPNVVLEWITSVFCEGSTGRVPPSKLEHLVDVVVQPSVTRSLERLEDFTEYQADQWGQKLPLVMEVLAGKKISIYKFQQIAESVDEKRVPPGWRLLCRALFSFIGQGRSKYDVDRLCTAIDKWATRLTATQLLSVGCFFDCFLSAIRPFFDLWKDVPDVGNVFRYLHELSLLPGIAGMAHARLPTFCSLRDDLINNASLWRDGHVERGVVASMLQAGTSQALRACCRALDVEGEPHDLLREQVETFEQLDGELHAHSCTLDWCVSNGVILPEYSAFNLRSDADRMLSSASSTVHAMRELSDRISGELRQLAQKVPGSERSVHSMLLHFHQGQSVIFRGLIARWRREHEQAFKNKRVDLYLAIKWLKECADVFRGMLNNQMPLNIWRVVVELIHNLDVAAEIHKIADFPFDASCQDRPMLVEQLVKGTTMLQFHSYAQQIVQVVTANKVVEEGDADLAYLRGVAETRHDQAMRFDEIIERYERLQEMFSGMDHRHLHVFSVVGASEHIVAFFKREAFHTERQEEFEELKQHLNIKLLGREFFFNLFNNVVIAFDYCRPFAAGTRSLRDVIRSVKALSPDGNVECVCAANKFIKEVETLFRMATSTSTEDASELVKILTESGKASVELRQAASGTSSFSISYSVRRLEHGGQEVERVRMTREGMQEHKRQLTFCLETDANAAQLREFRDRLVLLDVVVDFLLELESKGHPDFQASTVDIRLSDTEEQLHHLRRDLQQRMDEWIRGLLHARSDAGDGRLTLLSNKEVMVMMTLITSPPGSSVAQSLAFGGGRNAGQSESTARCQTLLQYLELISSFMHAQDAALPTRARTDKREALTCSRVAEALARVTQAADGEFAAASGDAASPASIARGLGLLGALVKEVLGDGQRGSSGGEEKQQFVHSVRVEDKYCAVLAAKSLAAGGGGGGGRLTMPQVLVCSAAVAAEELALFFARVQHFCAHSFFLLDVGTLSRASRDIVAAWQERLHLLPAHADVHYIFCGSPAVAPFPWLRQGALPDLALHSLLPQTTRAVMPLPAVRVFAGKVGAGKTFAIRKTLAAFRERGEQVLALVVNDELDRGHVVSQLLSLQPRAALLLSASSYAPLGLLNDVLFEAFVCGALRDPRTGLLVAFTDDVRTCTLCVECPFMREEAYEEAREEAHEEARLFDPSRCLQAMLPALALVANAEEVPASVPYEIGEMERGVCVYLDALRRPEGDGMLIDRLCSNDVQPVCFPECEELVRNDAVCREIIEEALRRYAPNTRRRDSKFHKRQWLLSLSRRFAYFSDSFFFLYNTGSQCRVLGSTLARQMLREADNLQAVDGNHDAAFPQVYLVYDQHKNPIPMCVDASILDEEPYRDLKALSRGGLAALSKCEESAALDLQAATSWDYLLAWAFSLRPSEIQGCLRQHSFVLEQDNCFKLILFHERRLAGLPAVLEGETGVGKTFVLEMYCHLLNLKLLNGRDTEWCPRMRSRLIAWLHALLRHHPHLQPPADEWVVLQAAFDEENVLDAQLGALWTAALERASNADEASGREGREGGEVSRDELLGQLLTQLKEWGAHALLDSEPLWDRMAAWEQDWTPEASVDAINVLLALQPKPLFYRLLIHPGIDQVHICNFLAPIIDLAERVGECVTLVAFFDEMNTGRTLGLFKELMVDRSLKGKPLPPNIFFAAAINPFSEAEAASPQALDANQPSVNRQMYFVHKLPAVMRELIWKVEAPPRAVLERFILRKIALFDLIDPTTHAATKLPLLVRDALCSLMLEAHDFFTACFGRSAVSNRDIQRTFRALKFFWLHLRGADDEQQRFEGAVRLAVAVVYYLRLPDSEAVANGNRRLFEGRMDAVMPPYSTEGPGSAFRVFVQGELEKFVSHANFEIPPGIALNQALKENTFALVICFCTKIPLGIVGAPGSSKTLSFHVMRGNLRGDHSPRDFCKQFPILDPFIYQCSEFTTSAEVESILRRALDREQQYERAGSRSRCMVFIDEAGLPDEHKMELKVLHTYLDEANVAFCAISNFQFDDANRNRMLAVTRSVAGLEDLLILAKGCLGMPIDAGVVGDSTVRGLCRGFVQVVQDASFRSLFHYRDLIYTCRCINRRSPPHQACHVTPARLLFALEENFNGVPQIQFRRLTYIFFVAIDEELQPLGHSFPLPEESLFRSELHVLRDALSGQAATAEEEKQDVELKPRFKLLLDPSPDQSGVRLLFDRHLLPPPAARDGEEGTHVLVMSEFEEDGSDLQCAALVSKFTFWMEQGHTVLLVNTGRIHGALYDVLNQHFRRMAASDGSGEKVYANVTVGAHTYACCCHPKFRCVVHLPHEALDKTPAPFLSRFDKFLLSSETLMTLQEDSSLSRVDRELVDKVRARVESFVAHVGAQHFYGFTDTTIASILFSRFVAGEEELGQDGELVLGERMSVQETSTFTHSSSLKNESRFRRLLRSCCAQVAQLLPPEILILKLKTLEGSFASYLAENYLVEHEHCCIANFASLLLKHEDASRTASPEERRPCCLKHVLFMRKTGALLGLKASQSLVFGDALRHRVRVEDTFRSQEDLDRALREFESHPTQQIIFLVVDTVETTRAHHKLLRHMLDTAEARINQGRGRAAAAGAAAGAAAAGGERRPRKMFVVMMHFPAQHLSSNACHAASFLRGWELAFFDMKHHMNPFHLRLFAPVLTCLPAQHRQPKLSRPTGRIAPGTPGAGTSGGDTRGEESNAADWVSFADEEASDDVGDFEEVAEDTEPEDEEEAAADEEQERWDDDAAAGATGGMLRGLSKHEVSDFVWSFATRATIHQARGTRLADADACREHDEHDNGMGGGSREVAALYEGESSVAAKARALFAVLDVDGCGERVTQALVKGFYSRRSDGHVRKMLLQVADAVMHHQPPPRHGCHAAVGWYGGFMETVASTVQGEFEASMASGLSILATDYGLCSLHRMLSTASSPHKAICHALLHTLHPPPLSRHLPSHPLHRLLNPPLPPPPPPLPRHLPLHAARTRRAPGVQARQQ